MGHLPHPGMKRTETVCLSRYCHHCPEGTPTTWSNTLIILEALARVTLDHCSVNLLSGPEIYTSDLLPKNSTWHKTHLDMTQPQLNFIEREAVETGQRGRKRNLSL